MKAPKLTDRQERGLDRLVEHLRRHDIDDMKRTEFALKFEPEAYPGRGHVVHVMGINSDFAVYAMMDPYGLGAITIMRVEVECDEHLDEPCTVCFPPEVHDVPA